MKKDEQITKRIARKLVRIADLQDEIFQDVLALSRHSKNRIAAHKAHVTMAKKAACRR